VPLLRSSRLASWSSLSTKATTVGALAALALVVRLLALLAVGHFHLAADPADYDHHARSIAAGHGYPSSPVAPGPTARRPPAFPYLLGAVYRLTGSSVTAGRVAQAAIGSIAVLFVALIAYELWGRRVAIVAGAFAAFLPPLVVDGLTLLSEPLFVAFELAAVFAILRWRRHARWPWLCAAGVLAGLAILTRSNGALLLLPLLVAARPRRPWRDLHSYRAPLALLACTVVTVAPWTVRNAIVMHRFVPVSDQAGTLAGTYNAYSRAHGGIWVLANLDPAYARLYQRERPRGEVTLDAEFRAAALRFAEHHPSYVVSAAARNTLRLFNLGGLPYERGIVAGDYGLGARWAYVLVYGLLPFLVLAVAGAATAGARAAPRWFWAIPVLMLSTILVLATNRFRAPIDPFIAMLAALGAVALFDRLRRPRPS